MKKLLCVIALLACMTTLSYSQAPTKKFIHRTEFQDSLNSIKSVARLGKLRVGRAATAVVIDSIRYSANGDMLKFFTKEKKMFRIYKTY